MLRIVLPALLLIGATSVRADWVKVFEDDVSVVYIDAATLVKAGNVRRAWSLTDLKQPRGDNVVSLRKLDDFFCKEARRRTVFLITYSGRMATGKVLESGKPLVDTPERVLPYSSGGSQFQYVCGE